MDQAFGDKVSANLWGHSRETWIGKNVQVVEGDVRDFRMPRFRRVTTNDEQVFGMCVDGVGTKTRIAERMHTWNTLGWDLVAMVADDAVAMGATPFMLAATYDIGEFNLAKELTVSNCMNSIGESVAAAALHVPVPLITGEFAQMGDMVRGRYDDLKCILNAALTWTASPNDLVSGKKIGPGDTIIGLREEGIRSNGFTALDTVLKEVYGLDWHTKHIFPTGGPEDGFLLGDLALQPSTLYAPTILLLKEYLEEKWESIHGMIHVTGGGLFGRIKSYMKRSGCTAHISSIGTPGILLEHLLQRECVTLETAYTTWNMGYGFLIITSSPYAVLDILNRTSAKADILGTVIEGIFETGLVVDIKKQLIF